MIQFYRGEEFKEIKLDVEKKMRYAISNQGRIISFADDIKSGKELKGGVLEGYKTFQYTFRVNGKRIYKTLFFYRLVAQYFLPKGDENQTFVLHLDFDKQNDRVENLRWANQVELTAHHSVNPAVIREVVLIINVGSIMRSCTANQEP